MKKLDYGGWKAKTNLGVRFIGRYKKTINLILSLVAVYTEREIQAGICLC